MLNWAADFFIVEIVLISLQAFKGFCQGIINVQRD